MHGHTCGITYIGATMIKVQYLLISNLVDFSRRGAVHSYSCLLRGKSIILNGMYSPVLMWAGSNAAVAEPELGGTNMPL